MAASAKKLFEKYNQGLIAPLPMKDVAFLDVLQEKNILSDDMRHSLEQFSETCKRSSYFLENIIKEGFDRGDDSCFTDLLAAMKENSYDNVKDLALQIQEKSGSNDNQVVLCMQSSYIHIYRIYLVKCRGHVLNLMQLLFKGGH